MSGFSRRQYRSAKIYVISRTGEYLMMTIKKIATCSIFNASRQSLYEYTIERHKT